VLGLRNKAVLERLYKRVQFSAREISRLAGASRSGVLNALDRFSIPREKGRPARTGHVPFGFDCVNHQLVKNHAEQAAIRETTRCRAVAAPDRQHTQPGVIPTRQNGIWQANTVRAVLARA
jgi:hypothetical protein